MNPSVEDRLCGPKDLGQLLEALALQIAEGHRPGSALRLVGIRTRGVPIAERLAGLLADRLGERIPVGTLDITLYRDDLDRRGPWPVLRGTEIPFDVDNAEIVLVDDVLFTGRTIRAALNAVCDLGRPEVVRLAVLVDRGGREIPIRADYVGMTVPFQAQERIRVLLQPVDPREEIIRNVMNPA